MMKNHKLHILILVLIILVVIFVVFNIQTDNLNLKKTVTFGVSFSPRYAQELELDPRPTYQSILTDLGTKSVRLSAYWDEIELEQDKFNFQDLDWYVGEASKNQAKVILAIGHKLPRWPECRAPKWLNDRKEQQLIMLEKVIEHFENNPSVSAWQVENEPLLNFGLCPKPDRQFLQKEVAFVRSKTKKPIIITDSGELRPWITPAKLSDSLGITLYRTVETPFFGTFQYPFPPWFYRLKSNLVSKKTIIVELQAEPWARESLPKTSLEEQIKRFSPEQFRKNVEFARKTGFEEIYLWGVEWWYYMALNGYPQYLEFAKRL